MNSSTFDIIYVVQIYMIAFPNAKINLGLYILNKRTDGYHSIETCFYPIPLSDILEIIPSTTLTFTSSGNAIPGSMENNLCIKTYESIKKIQNIPPVHIHLHKIIPIGAGLGGGSSDAAFTSKLLNEQFSLNLSIEQLEDSVRNIGSDCPFFIQNKSILAHDKGDRFSHPNIVDLSKRWIYLIYPPIHISTKEAYEGVVPNSDRQPLEEILRKPIQEWKHSLVNDFEVSIFNKYTELKHIKDALYAHGAIYASMSGSGSSIFGLFEEKPEVMDLDIPNSFIHIAQL